MFIRKLVGWGVLTLILFSCQNEIKSIAPKSKANEIHFSAESVVMNESRSQKRDFLGMLGRDSLFITVKEELNNNLFASTHDNRSRGIYGNNDFTKFNITAYTDDGQLYIDDQTLEKVSDDWDYSPKLYWLKNNSLHFFSYAWSVGEKPIEPLFSSANGVYSASFNYTLPASTYENNDAEKQPDIIFAIMPERSKSDGEVSLQFYHALSAIQFKLGEISEDFKVSKAIVSLVDVCSEGSCVLQYPMSNSRVCTWNYPTTSTGMTYTETIFESNDNVVADDSENFLMIPQSLKSSTASLKISLHVGEKLYEYEKPLKDLNDQWLPNYRYIYTFSVTKESVEVSVDDNYTVDVKNDVKIQNVGYSTSYIRAAIVGYWSIINSDGVEEIVASWDINDETTGTLVKPADWDLYWEEKNGIYYHLTPVTPGNYTDVPLFTKYTLTKTTGPVNGSKLNIHVVTQAIDSDGNIAKLNWPDAPMWE